MSSLKAFFWVILFCASTGLFVFQQYEKIDYLLQPKHKATPSPPPEPLGPPIVLTSTQLVADAAKQAFGIYVGKTIQLEADVEKRSDAKSLIMKTMSPTIICEYDPKDAPEGDALKEGDRVTVRGRVSQYFVGRIWLKSCRFLPRTTPLDDGWEIIKVRP